MTAVFSKPRFGRRGVSISALCLAMLALSQTTSAQYFAEMDYKRLGEEGEEQAGASPQLNGGSTWMDQIAATQKDLLNIGAFSNLQDQFHAFYGVVTRDQAYLDKHFKTHREKGALRSGEGTPEETHKRQRRFEERERIESMLEKKEVPSDIPTSNKMYEMWLEQQKDRPGLRNDDKYELVPHTTVLLKAEDVAETEPDLTEGRHGRMLKSSAVNGDDELTINRLEEPYPTECYNHGKLARQTQKYYMCKSLRAANGNSTATKSSDQAFRVDSETYGMLLQNYSDQYSCYTQNVVNNVCVCPQGRVDFMCATDLYTKCAINITEPAFYKGCENEFEDSFYYLYSVPGFSPCFWQNFSSSIDVEFELTCMQIDETGLVSSRPSNEVGYPYRDVISEPNGDPFTYVSSSPETEFAVEETQAATVAINFRDMKYLSHKQTFSVDLDNVDINGQTKGSVTVDFSKLKSDDATGNSKYVVGGRAYFEASVFGTNLNSFTFRGFFDEEGYEEPKSTLNQLKTSGWLYVIIGGVILLIILVIVLWCHCSKKKEQERQAKKQKHD